MRILRGCSEDSAWALRGLCVGAQRTLRGWSEDSAWVYQRRQLFYNFHNVNGWKYSTVGGDSTSSKSHPGSGTNIQRQWQAIVLQTSKSTICSRNTRIIAINALGCWSRRWYSIQLRLVLYHRLDHTPRAYCTHNGAS